MSVLSYLLGLDILSMVLDTSFLLALAGCVYLKW